MELCLRNFSHTYKFSALIINFWEVWPRKKVDLGKQFHLYALKTSWRHLCKTPCRRLQNVLKMSWRRFCKTSWRRFENVLARRLQDVSWRNMSKKNILVLIKAFWRRLEDVFWRWRRKTFSRHFHQGECLLGLPIHRGSI